MCCQCPRCATRAQLCKKQQPQSRGCSSAVIPRGVDWCRLPLRGDGRRLAHLGDLGAYLGISVHIWGVLMHIWRVSGHIWGVSGHIWGSRGTSGGSRCTSGVSVPAEALPAPARPARSRSRRPWPRCWNRRSAALRARAARASGRASVPSRQTRDIPPKGGATAATALPRCQQTLGLAGRCHTWWHRVQKWARFELEVIFTWRHDSGWGSKEKYHVHGATSLMTITLDRYKQCWAPLPRLWGSWVKGRVISDYPAPYISLHVEEVSTGKLPFASVMNCSLSQIQNKEVINCLPAGTEKPRNPCGLWEEHLL